MACLHILTISCILLMVHFSVAGHHQQHQQQMCKAGETWNVLHVHAGDSAYHQLSGRGNVLDVLCLSGWIWDLASGHPHAEVNVYQDSKLVATITDKVNATHGSSAFYLTGSNPSGTWALEFSNGNMLWNADMTLVIEYLVRSTGPSCSSCKVAGRTGPACNASCSSNCFACCQNDPTKCTVCALGRAHEPQCELECPSACSMCNSMGGCMLCKDPTKTGPMCNQCPPAPCRNPNALDCSNPCGGWYDPYFCKACSAAFEGLSKLIEIASKFYPSPKEAEAAVAVMETTCLVLTEFFAPACEIAVGTLADGGGYVIEWAFMESAKYLIGKDVCLLMGFCPPPTLGGNVTYTARV